jgi:tRNA-2-methylthio-N6-dimethylallyladenosine synthase
MKKIYIKTFGCQMNEYDSDKMADVLNAAEGLTPTDTPDDADVILFNTCSVREKAQEKVFHDLGRVRHLKQANPNLIIGVGGCVASQEGAAIVARALRRRGVRSADAAPAARTDRPAPRKRARPGRHQLP